MALEGWKDFPRPNPWFPPPVEPTRKQRRQERLASVIAWLSTISYLIALVGTLWLAFIPGWEDATKNGVLFIGFTWFGMLGGLAHYRQVASQRLKMERNIIPAETSDSGHGCLYLLFFRFPIELVGVLLGPFGSGFILAERHGSEEVGVRYVDGGKRCRRVILARKAEQDESLNNDSVVWITRPVFLLPGRPVSRELKVGVLDEVPTEVAEWLYRSLHPAEKRKNRIRVIRRRARNIKRIRREKGRGDAYRKAR